MQVGYARVSTQEQTLDLQRDALKKAGCERVFSDVISGAKAERPGLSEALEYMREGDTRVTRSWCGSSIGSAAHPSSLSRQ